MSTRSLQGIGTSTTTTSSSSSYLNRGLQLVGLFFFINGIYVAFFSANILTTFGYYFVVIAAICAVLSRLISPEEPLISPEIQRKAKRLANRSDSSRTTRSRGREADQRTGFDIRRYLRPVARVIRQMDIRRFTSGGNGRDRL
ncbi:hypothetical protein SAMN05444342_0262 [Haladaptatus paucihalophilus DX253]|uniref:Uncharacterized protein n=1 Tax=Haladaptatus paucihalophilus DX253 TaxID=797209 RepID=A0A1M6NZ48_HALPU|nr:hypothetical protein SAMN05444342_0262 [Haladaptatus paucihalophilus DX253]